MKKFIIALLFIFGADNIYAIDERVIDFYFGNGVWNTRNDAEKSRDALEKLLGEINIDAPYTIDLVYNWTEGNMDDVVETLYQLQQEGKLSVGFFVAVATLLDTDIGKIFIDDIIDSIEKAQITQSENLKEMLEAYQTSINEGHNVILISHSQGNLFGIQAYDKLDSWQKKYFKQISVATPASRVAGGGDYVTVENDKIIALLVDKISVILEPNAINTNTVLFETGMHHGFVDEYLNGDVTRGRIIGMIESNVDSVLYITPSQWLMSESATCSVDGCKNKVRSVTHRYNKSLDEKMGDNKVYPFEDDGKLYPTQSGYVKTDRINGHSVEELESGNALKYCYVLKNEADNWMGHIKKDEPCPKCNGTHSTPGFVEVGLRWESPKILLGLNVKFPNGNYDYSMPECRFEHFYSTSDSGVIEGAYPVMVEYEQLYYMDLVDKLSKDIIINIKVPGKVDELVTTYNQIQYNKGHVADIIVYKDNNSLDYTSLANCDNCSVGRGTWTGSSGGGGVSVWAGGGGGGGGGAASGGGRRTSGPYTPENVNSSIEYLYDILWYISKGALGPLSGADVKIYEAKDYDFSSNSGSNPVFISKTSEGSSVLAAGNILIPDNLEQDKLYVVEIKGGLDIDANDDAVVDNTPTVNHGKIRLVMSGYEFNNLAFKVNILTEIIYHLAKGSIDENNQTAFIEKSDEAAKCLLDFDMNFDGHIDTLDALAWMPFYGKDELLNHNYSLYYEPIINKIHNNQNIADNIAAMTKNPIFTNDKLYFFSNTTAGSNLGKAPYVCGFGFDKYSVKGEFAAYFDIDGSGNITLKTSPPESKEYLTDIEMSNGNNEKINGVVNIVMIDENAPFLVKNRFNNAIPDIIEDGFDLGQAVIVHEGKGPIKNIWLKGEGADNFEIDKNGYITISSRSHIDRKDVAYRLKVFASNEYGTGAPVDIMIYVYNEYELVPIVTDTSIGMYGTEIETNKVIGKMKAAENIFCPIIGFQTNSEKFGIKPNGDIYIKSYPSSNNYTIKAYAQSRCGNSNQANLSIDKLNRLIGEMDVSNAKRITLSLDNTKMFIAGGKDGIRIMDITNSNVPVQTGLISTDDAHDAFADNTKVYAADGANGIKIFDLSDNLTLIKSLPGINAQKISISKDGSQIYAVDKDAGLKIIDVSVPSSARIIGSIDSYAFYDVVQHPNNNNFLLTAGGFGGVKIYDITDTANPVLAGAVETTYARHITALGDLAYIADGSGVRIIDISDTSAPKVIGTAHVPNTSDAAVSNNNMQIYAAGGENGLLIIDARDILNPLVVNSINIIDAYSITLLDDMSKAYVIDSRGRVFIVAL